jgi:hypothetical protein
MSKRAGGQELVDVVDVIITEIHRERDLDEIISIYPW